MWTIAGDFQAALVSHRNAPRLSRKAPTNPIWNCYQCADGEWLLLVMPMPFPDYWPRFCKMTGRLEWVAGYPDLAALRTNNAELSAALDVIFAEHDRAHWMAQMDEAGLIWAPVAKVTEVIENPQVREMGWITEIDHPQYGRFETLDTPFKIYGSEVGVRGPAPGPGQHTFDILSELGITSDEVTKLATDGVLS